MAVLEISRILVGINWDMPDLEMIINEDVDERKLDTHAN